MTRLAYLSTEACLKAARIVMTMMGLCAAFGIIVLTGCTAGTGASIPDGSCFLVTKEKYVQDDGFTRTITIDRDEDGNKIRTLLEADDGAKSVTSYEYDGMGNCVSQTVDTIRLRGNRGGRTTRDYDITTDDDGVMTEQYWAKTKANSPDTYGFEDSWKLRTWQYGDDGRLQVATSERQADFACDECELWAVTYDSEGYPIREDGAFTALGEDWSAVEGSATVEIDWEYDSGGNAVGFSLSSGNPDVRYNSGQRYSVEADRYGNITKVWPDESPGTYYEYEYALVKAPSAFVAANSCKSYWADTWYIEPEKKLYAYTGYTLNSLLSGYSC